MNSWALLCLRGHVGTESNSAGNIRETALRILVQNTTVIQDESLWCVTSNMIYGKGGLLLKASWESSRSREIYEGGQWNDDYDDIC